MEKRRHSGESIYKEWQCDCTFTTAIWVTKLSLISKTFLQLLGLSRLKFPLKEKGILRHCGISPFSLTIGCHNPSYTAAWPLGAVSMQSARMSDVAGFPSVRARLIGSVICKTIYPPKDQILGPGTEASLISWPLAVVCRRHCFLTSSAAPSSTCTR